MRFAALLLAALFSPCAWAEASSCALPVDQQLEMQRALTAWERGSVELLHTSPTPLPWIVLIGPRCAWHLAPAPDAASFFNEALALSGGTEIVPGWVFGGKAIAVIAVPHDGRARLPDGDRVEADKPERLV